MANTKFIDSRKRDPSVEQREQALATLYTAFNEYKKTIGDLSQGLEVCDTMVSRNARTQSARIIVLQQIISGDHTIGGKLPGMGC